MLWTILTTLRPDASWTVKGVGRQLQCLASGLDINCQGSLKKGCLMLEHVLVKNESDGKDASEES